MNGERPEGGMVDVRRPDDGELCGRVGRCGGKWIAATMFGAVLGVHDDRAAAEEHLRRHGLACLTNRWTLRRCATDETEVVCIVEATPMSVTVARDLCTYPGVPLLTITVDQIATEWDLRPADPG